MNVEGGGTYLYGAVQVSGKAILNKQGGEVEHCQQQRFELSIVRAVTHQQPWHIFYRLARITENAVKAVQQIHPVVQLTLLWTQSIFGNKTQLQSYADAILIRLECWAIAPRKYSVKEHTTIDEVHIYGHRLMIHQVLATGLWVRL